MALRPVLLALLLALLAAVPAGAATLQIGVADQKRDMFSDPRFADAGIRHVRLNAPWDAIERRKSRTQMARWLAAARAAGAEPLVTFGHSREPDSRRVLPSATRFRRNFARFRERFPWVRNFATWNEANHCSEPVCNKPALAASYFDAMAAVCPTRCRLLGAEVIDSPSMVRWTRAFLAAVEELPRYWGLHNYLDANRFRTSGTRAFLRTVKGQIWFTETGGLVARRNGSTTQLRGSVPHAANATRWVLRRLSRLSSRIKRVYLYHWNSSTGADTWDSALIDHEGEARPAFAILRTELFRRARAARRRGAARAVARAQAKARAQGCARARAERSYRSSRSCSTGSPKRSRAASARPPSR
jgi:hypothetical protein